MQAEPLGRSDLLEVIRIAADATAAGIALPASSRELTGRSFELRLPFGCPGDGDGRWAAWTFDRANRVLRLTATAQRWDSGEWLAGLAPRQTFEAAEGFWIERPWTSSEKCPPELSSPSPPPSPEPAASQPAAIAAAAPRTAAIAEFFAPEAARTTQRAGRPYAFTLKAPDFDPQAPHTFRMRLTGRIAGFEDGQPVHCLGASPDLPPQCVLAVEFTTIAFENGLSGEVIKEWRR